MHFFARKAITRVGYRLIQARRDGYVCWKRQTMVGRVIKKALWCKEGALSRRLKT